MSALRQVMHVLGSDQLPSELLETDSERFGGLLCGGRYAWFASGSNIVLYSKQLGSVVSHRSFVETSKITCVKELSSSEDNECNLILIGCSFKLSGILFVCHLPTLTTVRCIDLPYAISYIGTITNEPYVKDQLCDEFKIMSTVLLVGMATGAVYAIDLRQNYIENQLIRNELVINELKLSQLFIIRKNEDCQEVKEMSDDSDTHLAMFINENFYAYCKKQYNNKLNLNVSSLLYIKEINTIAIGYSTGHFQLWDCKIMRTIYLLKEPKCVMPITHIAFLEPSDDPNNLCYLWVIQSDNNRLPNATMIALTYEQRIVMSNGSLMYKVYQGNGVKLEMSLKRETGIGRCISALSLCNVNLFRNETDMDEDCEIKLFAMLMEVRQNAGADLESYIFLFDINQWYKAQMPSNISHLKVSNSYASFVKLPHNDRYLDFNISDKSLRPFGYNFRNNVEELYYPSSIYFECDCLTNSEIIRFKHAGVQQEILDQLLSRNWRLLINPSLVFNQCLETNLRPFFWDKTDDYANYSLPDQRSFMISILVENKMMPVLGACAEEWKNGTYVSSEATILHLVQCLWKHVMVVKQYADKLCVPLFDYSGTQLDKKNARILNHCLSQMQCVKYFLEHLHNTYGVHIINVDYSYRVYTLNLVTDYFNAVICFLKYGLLPESLEEEPLHHNIQCRFTYLIQYANKRRMEFGDSQLFIIDAIVNNEPKGNKLIEQWLHEGGETTKGLYPPSNVQCLLRIYLNAALSDFVKNFITVYFLIDVCSSQDLNVTLANRMCNYAVEVDVKNNKGLNSLCRASWLLDHDMFEEAMEILSKDTKWTMINDKLWDWFHWTVLKLLTFKSEFLWARFYLKLININIETVEDHKFFINIQIMCNQWFDVLTHIRSRPLDEKPILYDYFFDRCRETNKIKCLLEYLWEPEEEELFFSYLKRFNDTESLNFQLLFLLQRGRYLEATKLNKSLEIKHQLKKDDALAITSVLVDRFDKCIPITMRQCFDFLPVKNLYKKSEIVIKCMNVESKMFSIMDKEKENVLKVQNSSTTPSSPIHILPLINKSRKCSPIHDTTSNIKRRKTDDDVILSPPSVGNKIPSPIKNQVLEILNTPLVEKTVASPSFANYSSILKTGSTKKHKRILSIRGDERPVSKTVLRFSLPGENDSIIEKIVPENITNIENNTNNAADKNNVQFIQDNCMELSDDISETNSLDCIVITNENYEETKISKESVFSEDNKFKLNEHSQNKIENDVNVNWSNKYTSIIISDDDDDDEELREEEEVEEQGDEEGFEEQEEKVEDQEEEKVEDQEEEKLYDEEQIEEEEDLEQEEDEEEISVTKNTNLTSNDDKYDIQLESFHKGEVFETTPCSIPADDTIEICDEDSTESRVTRPIEVKAEEPHCCSPNTKNNLINISKSQIYDGDNLSSNVGSSSQHVNKYSSDSDIDVVVLDSENENEDSHSSSIQSIDDGSISDESEMNVTKYGRFKCHNKEQKNESSDEYDEQDEDNSEQEDISSEEEDKVNSVEGNLSSEEEDKVNSDQGDVSSEEEDDDKVNSEHSDTSLSEEDNLEHCGVSSDEVSVEQNVNISSEEEVDSEQSHISLEEDNYHRSSEQSEHKSDEEIDDYSLENNVEDIDENNEDSNSIEIIDNDYEDEPENIQLVEHNIQMDQELKDNELERLNVVYFEDPNHYGQDSMKYNESKESSSKEYTVIPSEDVEKWNAPSKEESDDEVEIVYSRVLKPNSFENNSTSCTFEHASETYTLNNDDDDGDNVETENVFVVENDNIIDDNLKNETTIEDFVNETSTENDLTQLENVENIQNDSSQDETIDIDVQKCSSTSNSDYLDISRNESNPIPDDGFNHLTMPENEPNQVETNDVDQPAPFLFGQPFFGQQEISDDKPMLLFGQQKMSDNKPMLFGEQKTSDNKPMLFGEQKISKNKPMLFGQQEISDNKPMLFGHQEISDNKPMLLFGQVYSFENDQIVTPTQNITYKSQDLMTNTQEEIVPNKELEETEVVDDIQDILELESLPDSSPDENVEVQNYSRSNSACATHLRSIRASSEQKQLNMNVINQFRRAKSVTTERPNTFNDDNFVVNSKQGNNTFNVVSQHKSYDISIQKLKSLSPLPVNTYGINDEIDINFDLNNEEIKSIQSAKNVQFSKSQESSTRESKDFVKAISDVSLSKSTSNEEAKVQVANKADFLMSVNLSKSKIEESAVNQTINIISDLKQSIPSSNRKLSPSVRDSNERLLEQSGIKGDQLCIVLTPLSAEQMVIQNNIKQNKNITSDVKHTSLSCLEPTTSSGERKLRRSMRARSEQPTEHSNNETKLPCDVINTKSNEQLPEDNIIPPNESITTSVKQNSLNCLEQSTPSSKRKLRRSVRARSEQPLEQSVIEMKIPYIVLTKLSDEQKVEQNIINQNKSTTSGESKLRRSMRAKSEQPTEHSDNKTKIPFIGTNTKSDDQLVEENISTNVKSLLFSHFEQQSTPTKRIRRSVRAKSEQPMKQSDMSNEPVADFIKKKSLVNKTVDLNDINQHILPDAQPTQTPKKSRSFIKKVDQLKESPLDGTLVEDNPITSKSTDKEINSNQYNRRLRAKSTPISDDKTIVTRSRTNSENNLFQEYASIFRSSELVDTNRQTRIILPKNRAKNQHTTASTSRRTGRSQSVAHVEKLLTTKKSVFGLEQIPEEEVSDPMKIALENKNAPKSKKPKFNFFKNNPKKDEPKNIDVQQHSTVKTPRRAKSVQPKPPPALTLSVLNSKPKRSLSLNYLVSDDKSPRNIFKEFVEKFDKQADKPKKRSSDEPLGKRKKPKISTKKVQDIVESESVSHSSETSNQSSSFEEISPIAGNNAKFMMFTPAPKKFKRLSESNTSIQNDSDSDESTNSRRIMTRSINQNISYVGIGDQSFESENLASTSVSRETVKQKTTAGKPKKIFSSNKSDVQTPQKKADVVKEKPKIKSVKKKSIVQTSVQVSDEPQPSTSGRRITRSQQKLDQSLQSTSIIENESNKNTPVTKSKKKQNIKKTK